MSHYILGVAEGFREGCLKITVIIIRSSLLFLFIGREPTTWPANNCLQIMVCSCAMPSNCVWLQIIFCSCVKETVLFSFLRSLLRVKWQIASLPKDIHYWKSKLSDRMIKQLLNSVGSPAIVIRQCLAYQLFARHRQIMTFCSTSSNNC